VIYGGNHGMRERCDRCGNDHEWPGPHRCEVPIGTVEDTWVNDKGENVASIRVGAGSFWLTKEAALAEILAIMGRLSKDDQQRIVDALVALGAE